VYAVQKKIAVVVVVVELLQIVEKESPEMNKHLV
jgi:hypothetical protein